MAILELNCQNQSLEWVKEPAEVYAGNVNVDSVSFKFCELWDGLTKTAVFYREGATPIHILLDDTNTCKIPPEITKENGLVYIGVFGDKTTDNEYIRRTTEPKGWYLKEGVAVEGVPSEPTPDIYAQIIALCNEAVESAKNAENINKEVKELCEQAEVLSEKTKIVLAAETERVEAEQKRQENEQLREQTFEEFKTDSQEAIQGFESTSQRYLVEFDNKSAEELEKVQTATEQANIASDRATKAVDDMPNVYANALNGIASGEVIRVDDVSPLEHTVKAKISGENIEPASVTVARCGKNILGFTEDFSVTLNGLTVSYDKATQIFTLNGTPTASGPIVFSNKLTHRPMLKTGTLYTLSLEHISGDCSIGENNVFFIGADNTPDGNRNNWTNVGFVSSGKKERSAASNYNYLTGCWVYIGDNTNASYTDYKFRVQLEKGDIATDYELHKCETHTPNADGTLEFKSISPTMTFLTDTVGANIDVEYNQDINKVIGNVETALDSIIAIQNGLLGVSE